MNTQTIPAETAAPARPVTRLRAKVAAVLAFITCLVAPTAAFAQTPTDATGGAGSTFISNLQSQFLNYVVPAALGLMVAVLGISVLVAWGRKAVKSR